ncbi:MAG: bifunctional acetate--CoA ligase family protein/GNAT family N-acetyltransferase [Parachlamydiales bacterium]|nr:bifunctional acetate--CoA ligase family protein/GNAT family N-acetyltransferase [Parachlamydiales bacterium]
MHKESFDPSMNILHRRSPQLDYIFSPKTVAVVGATENQGSVGRTVMHNLSCFGGEVFPVNPKRPSVLGVKAYPDLKSIPKKVELVVVVTPAKTVPEIISEAADLGIPAAVIISAGFKEMGPPGIALEQEILKHARRGKMRIIGPNCLGVMNPLANFNATFAAGIAHPGKIAFISQSGALCTAVLDWSLNEKVGFSAFVSIGSMVDVDWGDLIDYFGNDPATQSILIYMESIGNPRSFLSAAREVSLTKPIILIKAGRSAESAKAAASHTGSLAGSDEAFSAALRRVGVLRVDTIADLFNLTESLAKQPKPKGPRLTIVTNAGGPGVIATDALIANGGKLAAISNEAMDQLNAFLPAPWSHNNPVDILGDADAERYAKAIEIAAKDPETDGILVILTPQDMTDSVGTAEELKRFAKIDKPILASWMGAQSVAKGDAILTEAGIPAFAFPDMACKTFAYMWNYTYNLSEIYEIPMAVHTDDLACLIKHKALAEIFDKARSENRTILDEVESKQVLEAYDIPCTPTKFANDAKEAVRLAKDMGFPVVLKVYSKTITHKTDVGGVKLNLQSAESVEKAYHEIETSVNKLVGKEHFQGVTVQPMIKLEGYELILGSTIDEQFGPIILFGSGGQLVEVYKDRALALPPLTTTFARHMMEQTKIYEALKGVRGRKAIDLDKLEQILVQFSNLVVGQPWIKECDINPLLASPDRLIALDARVILHDPKTRREDLPRPAIRPYPVQYMESWNLKDGTPVTIRPIRPEDEPLMVQFHKDLSQETVRQRYLKSINYDDRVAHNRLLRICFNDYDREIALLVEKEQEILGVIRLTKIPGTKDATFALTVKDRWQNKGIGRKLMQKILDAAQEEKVERIIAYMLDENKEMQSLCKRFGFTLTKQGKFIFTEKKC